MRKYISPLHPRAFLLCLAILFSPLISHAEESPWTTQPKRVERSKQDFERLPPAKRQLQKQIEEEKRFVLRLPLQITMRDSASFSARGKIYVLADMRPVPGDKICTSPTGSHWPCGRSAMLFAGKLLRQQLLRCESALREKSETRLSNCQVGKKQVEAEIIANGQGFAPPQAVELVRVMKKARQARKGIWRDQACFEQEGNC